MKRLPILFLLFIFSVTAYSQENIKLNPNLLKKANDLAQKYLLIDTHIDLPLQIYYHGVNPAGKSENDIDYYRAKKGGLDVAFMSVYVPPGLQGTDTARIYADSLITLVANLTKQNPDKFALAFSTGDVYKNFDKGLISLPMGMENGAPVTGTDMLKYYYDKGIRYITLTHSLDNHIGDSSYDTTHTNKGLTDFGKELIKEMNDTGIMVDVSHISDDTFYDVMEITEAPVIASHSSCRIYTPGFERNMSDKMIKLLAENGGVIQINFGSYFLTEDYMKQSDDYTEHRNEFIKVNGLKRNDPKVKEYMDEYIHEHPRKFADVSDVADHIDHVVDIAGIDYVGIGSDYDGVGDSLPTKLKDVSMYPNLIYELLLRNYSEEDIRKIMGGNVMRVWKEVEDYAANH